MIFVRTKRRTTLWNLFFNYFAVACALVSGVVLVPLYLKFLPLELYGGWLATGNILSWIVIVDPGLSTALMQQTSVAYGSKNTTTLNGLMTGGVAISAGIASVVLFAGFLASTQLDKVLANFDPHVLESLIRPFQLAVIGTALMVLSYGFIAINMGLQSSLGTGLVFAVSMVASLVLTVVLLHCGAGLSAIPAALVLRGTGLILGNVAYLLWRLRCERIGFRPGFGGIRLLLGLMSFTFVGRAAAQIAGNIYLFLLARTLGAEAAPVLALTRKAPDLSRIVLERPAVAFMPSIASLVGSGEVEHARAVLLRLLTILLWMFGIMVAGFLGLNRVFVELWVGASLFAGSAVNAVIVLGLVCGVIVSTLSNLCYALGNIKGNSIVLGIQAVVALPVMVVASKHYGILGVALAPVIAMGAVGLVYFPWKFSKLVKLRRSDGRAIIAEIARVVAAGGVTLLVASLFSPSQWLSFGVSALCATATYSLMLWIFSPRFRTEIRSLSHQTLGRLRRAQATLH
jgi:O-antigen/teichoic acid export membrane protein